MELWRNIFAFNTCPEMLGFLRCFPQLPCLVVWGAARLEFFPTSGPTLKPNFLINKFHPKKTTFPQDKSIWSCVWWHFSGDDFNTLNSQNGFKASFSFFDFSKVSPWFFASTLQLCFEATHPSGFGRGCSKDLLRRPSHRRWYPGSVLGEVFFRFGWIYVWR